MNISLAALIDIVSSSSTTITMPSSYDGPQAFDPGGETFEVIDAKTLLAELNKLNDNRPSVRFANLVGMTVEEAETELDSRSPHEMSLSPVRTIYELFRDKGTTAHSSGRIQRLYGTIGMLNGTGLLNEDELGVITNEGVITDIVEI